MVWAVIPVKPLNRAKSRLNTVLSPEQRYQLAQDMLKQVLTVVTQTREVTGTLVISRDTKALAIARDMGAKTIQESNPSDLNPALIRATEILRAWRAQSILIVPADLPFITGEDLSSVISKGQDRPSMVIATDRHHDGTNIMMITPPGVIQYAYGPDSFMRHIQLAETQGVPVYYYESETLRLDIDEPHDLDEYNRLVQTGKYNYLSTFYQLG